jgi:hypothetical protein
MASPSITHNNCRGIVGPTHWKRTRRLIEAVRPNKKRHRVRALLDAAHIYAKRNGTSRRGKPWRLLRMPHHLASRLSLNTTRCPRRYSNSWRPTGAECSQNRPRAPISAACLRRLISVSPPGPSSSRTDPDWLKHGKVRCPAVRLLLSLCCSATWPCRRAHTDSSHRQRDRQVLVIRRSVACRSVPPIPACSAIPAASATRRAFRRSVQTLRRRSSPPHPPLHHRHV